MLTSLLMIMLLNQNVNVLDDKDSNPCDEYFHDYRILGSFSHPDGEKIPFTAFYWSSVPNEINCFFVAPCGQAPDDKGHVAMAFRFYVIGLFPPGNELPKEHERFYRLQERHMQAAYHMAEELHIELNEDTRRGEPDFRINCHARSLGYRLVFIRSILPWKSCLEKVDLLRDANIVMHLQGVIQDAVHSSIPVKRYVGGCNLFEYKFISKYSFCGVYETSIDAINDVYKSGPSSNWAWVDTE